MIQLWSSALLFTNGDQTACSQPSALYRIQTDLTSEYIIIPVSHSWLLYQINISLSCYSNVTMLLQTFVYSDTSANEDNSFRNHIR